MRPSMSLRRQRVTYGASRMGSGSLPWAVQSQTLRTEQSRRRATSLAFSSLSSEGFLLAAAGMKGFSRVGAGVSALHAFGFAGLHPPTVLNSCSDKIAE